MQTNINILIPMGGKGLRFKKTGMSIPKPLVEVDGMPMIKKVIQSLKGLNGHITFVVRKEHQNNYLLGNIAVTSARSFGKNSGSYVLNEDNRGQVETCLEAIDNINNNEPLFIVNCDNYLIWNQDTFESLLENKTIDGAAFTFTDKQKRSHWCFAEVDQNNNIVRLAEKEPISDIALAGGFYWRKGSDFVRCAKELIARNQTASNGEFYLGSVFNMAIMEGKKIVNYPVDDMKCFGTPEELEEFNKWLDDKKATSNKEKLMNRNLQDAIDELRAGKPIVLIDEHDRENEGDIVIAAETANIDNLVFTMNNARGLMCIPCDGEILDRLEIPLMVETNTDKNETPFTVSVDASNDTSTGMSVQDRLKTISVFIDPDSNPQELNRPGHLFPLRPKPGLLKERRGHTEGSIELMKLAGLKPVSIICEIMNNDGTMAKGGQINKFATENGLTLISIEELYEAVYGESL